MDSTLKCNALKSDSLYSSRGIIQDQVTQIYEIRNKTIPNNS